MRPRQWRRRAAWTALALLALAGLRIVLGKTLGDWVAAREHARFEREIGPLDPARLAAPELADEENAVPAIHAAVERLALDPSALEMLPSHARSPTAEEIAALDALLAERDGALETLAAAARRPGSSFGPRETHFRAGKLAAMSWLRAARLAAADGQRALATGSGRRVARAQATLHGMTVTLRREPLAVFAILGAAAEELGLELVQARVEAGLEPSSRPELEGQLTELRGLPNAFEVAHGEGVFGYDMLARQELAPPPSRGLRARIEALVWPWSEGHVEAGALEGWRELANLARTPQARWPSKAEIAAGRRGALRRWLDPTVPFETLRAMLLVNLLDSTRKLQLLAAGEQLAGIAVAIPRERADGDGLPATLAGLPGARSPDAASGSLPSYALAPNGDAILELAAARELARATPNATPGERRRARLLRWRIPAARTL